MTRLMIPAIAVLLAAAPAWAGCCDEKAAGAENAAMKCGMMGEMGGGAAAKDVAAKLTAKKKELKLNDKQIQQIAAALAESDQGMKMGGMGMMKGHEMPMMGDKDKKAEAPAAGHEGHQH